jgi:hypothetical protein
LRVWREGKGGVWKKRKEQVEEIDDVKRGKLWEFIFLDNIKSSSFVHNL